MSEQREAKLSLSQLVWIATGQVVGAGVVTIVGSALAVTGYSAWFAYSAAVIMGLLRILPQMFFFSALVVPGGVYGMVTRTCGKQFGGLMTISSLINWVARGTAVLSVGNYLSAMFPSLNPVVMALIVWGFLTIANLFGVDVMAKIQSFATPCLLICLFVFSGLCAFHVQPGYMDFTGPDMFTNGLTGWLSAVVLLNYSTNGHSLISNFAPRAENPKKNIPLSMIITTGIIFCLYTAVGFASGAVLPLEVTANGTLTETARYLLPTFLYYVFMFGGPIFALLTTMNSGIMNSAMPVLAGVKEGWLPAFLAKQNKHGAYWVSILIIFVVGAVPVCTGMSVSQITNTCLILQGFQNALILVAGFIFPLKYAQEWKASWLHIPNGAYFILMVISGLIQAYVIIQSLMDLNFHLAVINLIILLIAVVYGFVRMKTATITETDYV